MSTSLDRGTRILAAAIVLLAALGAAPAGAAPPTPEQKKVWRALTEQEPRGAPPSAARPAAPAARRPTEGFPSEIALALVVGGVVAAILAVSALQARRRPPSRAERPPAESDEGSSVERLWRTHLRRKRSDHGPGRLTSSGPGASMPE